jgi:hypothetical protein
LTRLIDRKATNSFTFPLIALFFFCVVLSTVLQAGLHTYFLLFYTVGVLLLPRRLKTSESETEAAADVKETKGKKRTDGTGKRTAKA